MPTTPRTPNKTRQLTASGIKAQENYLQQGLKLLHSHGTLRVRTLAFALFPNRTEKAALAAAYRVLANAADQGCIEFADEKKSRHRYYALSRSGAAYLRATGVVLDAAPTTALLNKTGSHATSCLVKARHREWTNVLAIAAKQRGRESWSETAYADSGFRADAIRHIGHVPDALTVIESTAGKAVIWHEVELSRRSRGPNRTVKRKDQKSGKVHIIVVESGQTKLVKLVTALRQHKVLLDRDGEPHIVHLMLHCATPLIAGEVTLAISNGCDCIIAEGKRYVHMDIESQQYFRHLLLPLDTGKRKSDQTVEFLNVYIELLPHKGDIDRVWRNCELPWEGAGPCLYPKFGEQFVRTVGEGTGN